jgi:hypothetical protein
MNLPAVPPRPAFTGNSKSTPRHPNTVACLLCEVDWIGDSPCWLCDKPGILIEFAEKPVREMFGFNNAATWQPHQEVASE